MSEHATEAAVVAELAVKAGTLQVFEVMGVPFIAAPNGVDVTKYDELLERPRRVNEGQLFRDAESFGAYVNRFKDSNSLMLGNRDNGKFQCVLDYHESGTAPRWGEHVAWLNLRQSDEWKAWNNIPAQVGQVQFAEFIEDWMHTIAAPDGATLQGLVTKFHALKETTFKSQITLANGDVNLTYIEDSERGTEAGTCFPPELTLIMPIFEGQLPIQVDARIRYRINGGKLTFQIAIVRKTEIVRKAFEDVCEAVENITGMTPLMSG